MIIKNLKTTIHSFNPLKKIIKSGFIVAATVLYTLFSSLLFPLKASADMSGEWVDAAHIKIGDKIYIDNKIGDGMNYYLDGMDSDGECADEIKGFNNDWGKDNTDYGKAKFIDRTKDPETAKCSETDEVSITLSETPKAKTLFNWVDGNTIETTFIKWKVGDMTISSSIIKNSIPEKPNTYIPSEGECKVISLDVTSDEEGSLTLRIPVDGCHSGDPFTVKIGNAHCKTAQAGVCKATVSSGDGLTGESDPTCETTGGNPASWFLCPAINGMSATADWIFDKFIVPFLDGVLISTNSSSSMFKAWSGFRIIANVILIGLLLAAAVAQGIGKQ